MKGEITFTKSQYEKTAENIEEGAKLDAAQKIWDEIKRTYDEYTQFIGAARMSAKEKTVRLSDKLNAFKVAMWALGCELEYFNGHDSETGLLYTKQITLTYDGYMMGHIGCEL